MPFYFNLSCPLGMAGLRTSYQRPFSLNRCTLVLKDHFDLILLSLLCKASMVNKCYIEDIKCYVKPPSCEIESVFYHPLDLQVETWRGYIPWDSKSFYSGGMQDIRQELERN